MKSRLDLHRKQWNLKEKSVILQISCNTLFLMQIFKVEMCISIGFYCWCRICRVVKWKSAFLYSISSLMQNYQIDKMEICIIKNSVLQLICRIADFSCKFLVFQYSPSLYLRFRQQIFAEFADL